MLVARRRRPSPTRSSTRLHAPPDDADLPAGDRVLRRMHARAARLRAAGRPHLRRGYPYFSSFSDALMPPRCRARRAADRDRRLGPGVVRGRGRQQRRLSAAQLRRAPAFVRSASTRRPGPPQRPRLSACRRSSASSGSTPAEAIAAEHGQADVIVANNVMAHVPDLNDFVGGFADAARRRRRADGREPVRP